MDAIIINKKEQVIREEKIERLSQEECNAMMLYLLSCLFFYFIGLRFLQTIMEEVPKYVTSRMMEGIALILFVLFLKFTPFRLYRTGFAATWSEIKRTLIRCGGISILLVVVLVVARLVMTNYNSEIAMRPWFYPYFEINMRWMYPFVAILQEFLSKSVMQESLKRFFGEGNVKLAILACGVIFSILHMGYPLYYMLCAGLMSIFTGYIYEKDRTIWGCVLIHFCIGFLPRAMGLK